MKQKLLLFAVALLCSISTWAAYTDYLTGWTQITTEEGLQTAISNDSYFALVSGRGSDLMIKSMSYGGDECRLILQSPADPVMDKGFAWVIEYSNSKYYLKNANSEDKYWGYAGSAPWDYITKSTYSEKNSASTALSVTISDNKFTLATAAGGTETYIGPWTDSNFVKGQRFAGNKTSANAENFLLYAISKTDYLSKRTAIINAATGSSGQNVTFLLPDANFDVTKGLTPWTGDIDIKGQAKYGSYVSETYHKSTNIYQTITVPNGKYSVSVQGTYRQDESSTDKAVLYVGSETSDLTNHSTIDLTSYTEGNDVEKVQQYLIANPATKATINDIYVNDGSLTLGVKTDAANADKLWVVYDNFQLTYYGPTVKNEAIVLPVDGSMSADTWYYKDVTSTGIHAFSASDLGDIVYTTTENDLISDVSTTLPQNFLNSASTRYYFKSSSAQTLTISKICDNYSYWYLRTGTNSSSYKYLSRGGNNGALANDQGDKSYNAKARADVWGLPVRIAYESSNINFIYDDNWHHVFDANNGNLFGDGDSNVNFAMEPTDGGYYIVNKNTTSNSTNGYKWYIDPSDNFVKMSNENATIWTLESVSDGTHKTQMQAVKDAQATFVATSAGVTWVNSQATLNTYLSNTSSEYISITGTGGTNSEAYQKDATNTYPYSVFTETKTGLTPGLYKLSVKAFERFSTNTRTYDQGGGNPGLAYVYAGDQKVQLWSVFDFPADDAYSTQNIVKDEKNYPNGQNSAQEAFNAGKYVNEVFVWVTGSSLKFGIEIPQSYDGNTIASNTDNWICYNNFELTYYGDAQVIFDETSTESHSTLDHAKVKLTRTLSSEHWNTFCSPVSIDAATIESKFGDGTLITELDDETAVSEGIVTFKSATAITAGTPYLIKPATTTANPTFDDVAITATSGSTATVGDIKFIGVIPQIALKKTEADESVNYFVNTSNKVVQLSDDGDLKGMRAYFNVGSGVSLVKLFIDGIETGIEAIDNGQLTKDNAEIFNLSGQKLSKPMKGVNIVNGRKVLVK